MGGRKWTTKEEAQMRALYPELRAKDVAAIIGRPVNTVHQKAAAMGLRKSEAFKASDLSSRISRGMAPGAVRNQFPKGNSPWNKGKPGSTGTQAGCRATQFKAGRRPDEAANYQPIGTLRVSKDGYLERKVSDAREMKSSQRWVAEHRLVWERAHGPIPAGNIVVFRPSMRTADLAALTADRLECITRAEHAYRNHPRNRDPELGRLIQLKGAITRQVNRIAREAQENAS